MTNYCGQNRHSGDHRFAWKFLSAWSLFGNNLAHSFDFAQASQHSDSSFDVLRRKPFDDSPSSQTFPETTAGKYVRFNDANIVIHEIDHRQEEKKLIWYRNKELKRIRKEGQETVQLLHSGEICADTEDHCVLGLDCFGDSTHPYAKQRSLHKMLLRDIVLQEQRRQSELGNYFDEESLAAKVREFTSRCRHAEFVARLRMNRTTRRGVIN